jgi:sortase B
MKRKKKNKLWMLQAALCGVCILSAALLYQDYVTVPRKNRELVEALKTCFPEELPPGGGSLGQKEEQAGRETEVSAVDLRSLQSQYPDVRGWLTIPESGIDYPVLQSSPEEPEYYLRRDYRGNYDINGSLFLQADCILGESGKLTIYGHNMNSGAMFGNLDQYASYEYWKAHPSVFFQTPEGMEEYQIAAVLKADVSMFDFQRTSFQSPQELEAYVAQAKALSLFETGVDGIGCEKTLTLVTCSYEWKQARNILVAVKAGA